MILSIFGQVRWLSFFKCEPRLPCWRTVAICPPDIVPSPRAPPTPVTPFSVWRSLRSPAFSNILGVFLTPALVGILMQVSGRTGSFGLLFLQLMLLTLVPFVVGMVLRPLVLRSIDQNRKWVNRISNAVILFINLQRSGLEENEKLVFVLVISMLVIFGITFALNHYVFRLSPGENALQSLSVGFPRFPVGRPCNRSRAGDVGSDRTGSDSLGGPPRRISRHPLWIKLWSQVPGCRLHAFPQFSCKRHHVDGSNFSDFADEVKAQPIAYLI